jgi:hypothetical protein
MPQAGDVVSADHVNWAQTKTYYGEATSALGASQAAQPVPGISVVFTTETDGASLDTSWTMRADPTGSTTAQISARPSVTGPGTFSQATTNFAVHTWAAGAAGDVSTDGNGNVMTLGDAGVYTAVLLGTTNANQAIGLYSSLTCRVTEVLP